MINSWIRNRLWSIGCKGLYSVEVANRQAVFCQGMMALSFTAGLLLGFAIGYF